MTTSHYLKVKLNRDRFDVISGQIREAETLLEVVKAEPKESQFEVRPAYASPAVGTVRREVLCAALRQYLAGKEQVLTQIEAEFGEL
jgi:hypothetical protein